ncbi:hypothetical protein L7F22_028139 [Adiantum nelumboides]|nr:hypothetical protein [Adiantum nelumboides]
MEVVLCRQEWWSIVSGTSVCPPLPAQNPTAAEQAAYDEWCRKDLAAQTELLLVLGDRQVQMVRDCATSHEVWDCLHQQYEYTDLAAQVTVNRSAVQFLDEWNSALDSAIIAGL